MATKRIDQLPDGSGAPDGDELIPCWQAAGTKKLTPAQVKALLAIEADDVDGLGPAAQSDLGMVRPRIKAAGEYYLASTMRASTGASAVVADRLYLYPLALLLTIDALAIEVTSAVAGNARMGLYSADANGMPDALVEEAAEISTGATGMIAGALAADRALTEKMWMGVVFSAAPTCRNGGSALNGDKILGMSTFDYTTSRLGFYAAHTYGALPADLSAASLTEIGGAGVSAGPQLGVRGA